MRSRRRGHARVDVARLPRRSLEQKRRAGRLRKTAPVVAPAGRTRRGGRELRPPARGEVVSRERTKGENRRPSTGPRRDGAVLRDLDRARRRPRRHPADPGPLAPPRRRLLPLLRRVGPHLSQVRRRTLEGRRHRAVLRYLQRRPRRPRRRLRPGPRPHLPVAGPLRHRRPPGGPRRLPGLRRLQGPRPTSRPRPPAEQRLLLGVQSVSQPASQSPVTHHRFVRGVTQTH
mmetsp:Transcript_15740/g.51448  ORF Transcript_15740/g.51448 Transcript_15740/m.51448 type:complete len:230 (+) Transcript_15740:881-1570(+)